MRVDSFVVNFHLKHNLILMDMKRGSVRLENNIALITAIIVVGTRGGIMATSCRATMTELVTTPATRNDF